jgi:hypothetical protein
MVVSEFVREALPVEERHAWIRLCKKLHAAPAGLLSQSPAFPAVEMLVPIQSCKTQRMWKEEVRTLSIPAVNVISDVASACWGGSHAGSLLCHSLRSVKVQ